MKQSYSAALLALFFILQMAKITTLFRVETYCFFVLGSDWLVEQRKSRISF